MQDESDVLDVLYEAAVQPELWPDALDRLAGLAGASGGILFTASARFAGYQVTAHLREAGNAFVRDDWSRRNVRTSMALASQHVGFVRDSDFFSDEELARDPIQVELLLPSGLGREIATLIRCTTGETMVASLHRPIAQGCYADDVVAMLDRIRPHLARAALLGSRLRMQRLQAAMALLDAIGLPAAIIDPGARVLAANTLMDATPQVVSLAFGRLGLRRADANARFAAAVASLSQPNHRAPLSLLLAAETGLGDAVLHVVPLRRGARDLMAGAAAVVVITPAADRLPSALLLQSLFELTPAEARVAAGLLNGSVQQIASESGLSAETIRSQVKAILRKTGTDRQSRLVGLLTRLSLIDAERLPATAPLTLARRRDRIG